MIAVDHFSGLAQSIAVEPFAMPFPTWTRLGWSSAAEFFVFFSGYIVAMVYSRTLQHRGAGILQARAVHRAWQIYVANLLTLCAVLLALRIPLLSGGALQRATGIGALTDSPDALTSFLTLQDAPALFEILHLYIVLLMIAAPLLLIVRANIPVAVGGSLAVWLGVQFEPQLNLAAWHFNPFAWQLMFALGMICSVGRVFERLDQLRCRRTLFVCSAVFLGAALLVKAVDKAGWSLPLLGRIDLVGTEKSTLGPLRVVHFVASVVFVVQIVPVSQRLAKSRLGQAVARVGQYSLECFCLSTLLAYIGAAALAQSQPFGSAAVLAMGCLILLLLCGSAPLIHWFKSEPWRAKPRSPAASEASVTIETASRSITHARQ